MKKILLVLAFSILFVGLLPAQQLSLDTVIERSARSIEEILPQRTKLAVLNFSSTSETFSDYVIEELTGKLVLGRKVTIVDRKNLTLISQEMNLQLSGEVSDESAQTIGRMLGAQSIISGTLTNMGTYYRFRVRVINVETAEIQTQISFDMRNDSQVAFLLGGSSVSIVPPAPDGKTTGSGTNNVATTLSEGIIVPGVNLTEKLAWLDRSADSHNTYILTVTSNETIAPYTFEFRGTINITVVIRGDTQNRIVRLRSNGTIFTVSKNVTFVLENNITLYGHNGNNGSMINVNGGTLKMRAGSFITGNSKIGSGNDGGGVMVSSGTFEMSGGTISGNTGNSGGGVVVSGNGTFTMSGGTITGNTGVDWGGGVWLAGGSFTMAGGTISGNTSNYGGGVYIWGGGTFTMRGGTIAGNLTRENGGGVFVSNGVFTKNGGIITGYNSDSSNGNVVKDEAGNILARRGHAVFVNENLRKETTAGSGVNLSNRDRGRWD